MADAIERRKQWVAHLILNGWNIVGIPDWGDAAISRADLGTVYTDAPRGKAKVASYDPSWRPKYHDDEACWEDISDESLALIITTMVCQNLIGDLK